MLVVGSTLSMVWPTERLSVFADFQGPLNCDEQPLFSQKHLQPPAEIRPPAKPESHFPETQPPAEEPGPPFRKTQSPAEESEPPFPETQPPAEDFPAESLSPQPAEYAAMDVPQEENSFQQPQPTTPILKTWTRLQTTQTPAEKPLDPPGRFLLSSTSLSLSLSLSHTHTHTHILTHTLSL